MRTVGLIFLSLFLCFKSTGQIHRDYVVNGGFEDLYDCSSPPVLAKAKGWTSIDSQSVAGGVIHKCNAANLIPKNGSTWQFPKNGQSYSLNTMFSPAFPIRGYLRNRMKSTLQTNNIYCVRFYINIANTSPRGMDGFGAYFADSSLDTITKCTIPLSYLNPQVKNPLGNVISDTLNWVPITGTFVATGNEKYMVIGNFLADNAVTTSTINGPFVNEEWTDVCIDDVSCFDIDLPAYAGPDKPCIVGDSVFIGSKDPGLDEFCTWYQLPNTTVPIATVSGLYVKPIQTTTYVVRQQLWCSGVKYDTVIVYKDAVGLEKLRQLNDELLIVPQPANDVIVLSLPNANLAQYFQYLEIIDAQGCLVKEVFLDDSEPILTINTADFASGVYLVRLSDKSKEFVITKKLSVLR